MLRPNPDPLLLLQAAPCDARYDVRLNDGRAGGWQAGMPGSGTPGTDAVVDMLEQRLPDEWGDPGRLLTAELARYWTRPDRGQHLTYELIDLPGMRRRMALWLNGGPIRVLARHQRYLRWHEPDWEPPIDPEFEDPA